MSGNKGAKKEAKKAAPKKTPGAKSTAAPVKPVPARTLVLPGCPKKVTRADLKKIFPNVQRVHIKPSGKDRRCFCIFPSPADAQKMAAKKSVAVQGQNVSIFSADEWKASRAKQKDEGERTVVLTGCPKETNEKDAKKVFPKAQLVKVVAAGDAAKCYCVFASADEAREKAKTKDISIRGTKVKLGETAYQRYNRLQEAAQRTIFLPECPKKVAEKDVKKAFPNVQTVGFAKADAAGKRKCFCIFASFKDAQEKAKTKAVNLGGANLSIHSMPALRKRSREPEAKDAAAEKPAKKKAAAK